MKVYIFAKKWCIHVRLLYGYGVHFVFKQVILRAAYFSNAMSDNDQTWYLWYWHIDVYKDLSRVIFNSRSNTGDTLRNIHKISYFGVKTMKTGRFHGYIIIFQKSLWVSLDIHVCDLYTKLQLSKILHYWEKLHALF